VIEGNVAARGPPGACVWRGQPPSKADDTMSAGRYRRLLIAVVLLLLFAATAALTLHFLPRPWRRGDYLVAGSVATLVTLLALFVFLGVAGVLSGRISLGRRRPR